ncbi:MAG: hypothetical protein IPL89_03315 [Acidobacteria bacterium]|nr:hypothetical protein [Acidobacteriota bacterium]
MARVIRRSPSGRDSDVLARQSHPCHVGRRFSISAGCFAAGRGRPRAARWPSVVHRLRDVVRDARDEVVHDVDRVEDALGVRDEVAEHRFEVGERPDEEVVRVAKSNLPRTAFSAAFALVRTKAAFSAASTFCFSASACARRRRPMTVACSHAVRTGTAATIAGFGVTLGCNASEPT